jgi:hypothetical protein
MNDQPKTEPTPATTGHDMSRYWRLVSNEGGLITGTWWVSRPNGRGEQHVKPIDVVMWSEGRYSGVTLHSEDPGDPAAGVVVVDVRRDGIVEISEAALAQLLTDAGWERTA